MKIRLFVGFSAVLLVLAALAYNATAYQYQVPGTQPINDPGFSPGTPQIPQSYLLPAQTPQASLPEMVAKWRDLRRQELEMAKAIRDKVQEQKKSLEEVEKELDSPVPIVQPYVTPLYPPEGPPPSGPMRPTVPLPTPACADNSTPKPNVAPKAPKTVAP